MKVAIKALGRLGGRLGEQWLAHVVPLVIQEFKATRSKEAVMGHIGLMETPQGLELVLAHGGVEELVETVLENHARSSASEATSKEALGTNDTAYLKHTQAMSSAITLFESVSLVDGMSDVLVSPGVIPMILAVMDANANNDELLYQAATTLAAITVSLFGQGRHDAREPAQPRIEAC